MGEKAKITIRYCGGCNPEIDRGLVVKKLRAHLDQSSVDAELVFQDKGEICIMISGCEHSCLIEENYDIHGAACIIFVNGRRIDNEQVNEGDIPAILYKKILDYLNEYKKQAP